MSGYQLMAVFLMALFTYLPRFIPLTFYRHQIKSRFVKSALYYLPYAVLGALTFPGVIHATPQLMESLAGCAAAVFFSYREKGLVFVAVVSIAVSYLVHVILILGF